MYCSCQKVKRIFTKTIVEDLPGIQIICKLLHVEKVTCVKMYTLPTECMHEWNWWNFFWIKVLAIYVLMLHIFELHDLKLTECFRKRLNYLTNFKPSIFYLYTTYADAGVHQWLTLHFSWRVLSWELVMQMPTQMWTHTLIPFTVPSETNSMYKRTSMVCVRKSPNIPLPSIKHQVLLRVLLHMLHHKL